ncbi:hypothetical protein KP509_39G039300 [Ceratopteris richardii]|uniref:ACT domain-containing protein n=1 Tax=Ceratopteris richardii TaxID=49495 RepID=A0A8T2Q0J4_CERRI|nr:hypothetical protein KP509_39G039300 [Ceratopteris richardii]
MLCAIGSCRLWALNPFIIHKRCIIIVPSWVHLDVDIATHIRIIDEGPNESLVLIETADRPGLLREIVKILTDINVRFRSGEFDTEGLVAKSRFHVNYRGEALSKSMKQVLSNCFQYYLRRPETNVGSY